ncbi:hypothetical protein B296_00034133 [Ensete ventricosum]|uniref:Uncharacterized protein n=1 Tax=Ensete ventricosum TaxID=4639 RepID=A0A427A992_ENSVE|nr:hypothetical protein B296_00034133 [Ensete ventricosum]
MLSFDGEERRALLCLYKKLRPARAANSDRRRAEPESSDPQTATAVLYFIVKQRSRLEKTIGSYGFAEIGWRLGSNGSRVETTQLDSVATVVANRGLLLREGINDRTIHQTPGEESGRRWSGHVELAATLAPPRLRVVLGDHRPARRHRHVDWAARRATAALGRAQRGVRPRPAPQLPPSSRPRLLRPPSSG